MHSTIQEIKASLRLAMNGVASTSMREKGATYRLNFGVNVPTLRRMAQAYTPSALLAQEMWKEDIRELKILATLLYPPAEFTQAQAWVEQVGNLEIAEQASMNLFSKMPQASQIAMQWLSSSAMYTQLCGFLVATRCLMQGHRFSEEEEEYVVQQAIEAYQKNSLFLQNAVVNLLYRLTNQGEAEKEKLQQQLANNTELLALIQY